MRNILVLSFLIILAVGIMFFPQFIPIDKDIMPVVTIPILAAIGFIGANIWLQLKLKEGREQLAENLVNSIRTHYPEKYEYRIVESTNYQHLDLNFYDTVETLLKQQGFTLLGDYAIDSIQSEFSAPTFIRSFLSTNNTVVVSIYHALSTRPDLVDHSSKVTDCGTEFSNGYFLTTNNAELAGAITMPPQILRHILSRKTSALEVLNAHVLAVEKYLEANPGVRVCKISSLQECFAQGNRVAKLKADHRKSLGYIYTREELKKLAPNRSDADIDKTIAAMRKVVAKQLR